MSNCVKTDGKWIRIAIQFPIEFEEITIKSLKIDNASVNKANLGDPVGILWPSEKPSLKEGFHVFKVKIHENEGLTKC